MARFVLDRRLVLEEAQDLPDSAGGFVRTWTALGELWGAIRWRPGGERRLEAAAVSRIGAQVIVRAAPHDAPSRPRPDQRFRDGTRVFAITAVREADPGGAYLICQVEEQVAV